MNRNEIATLLPEIYRRTLREGSPLNALLEVMEALHSPVEEVLTELPSQFDPLRASGEMVAYLAGWVGLGWLVEPAAARLPGSTQGTEPISSGLGQLRELVSSSSGLARERGTRNGLVRFLEIATGQCGFRVVEEVVDASGSVRPFHFLVEAPPAALKHFRMILQIIEMEKPVHVTYELTFGSSVPEGE